MPAKAAVLIVDDNEDFRESLCDILQDWNYKALSASTGVLALDRMNKTYVDIVLLDMRMPDMNGLECLNLIRKYHPEVKVIMITTYPEEEKKALEKGAIDVLIKPLNLKTFRELLDKVTGKNYA